MTRAEAVKVLHNTAWIGKEGDENKELEELRFRIRKLEILNGWEEADNEKP